MFIQNINNLSGGFMPSQGAFLWSDKLYLDPREKTQVHLRLNASTFYLKRKYVLSETQLRFTSNARTFGPKRKGVFGGFQKGERGKT